MMGAKEALPFWEERNQEGHREERKGCSRVFQCGNSLSPPKEGSRDQGLDNPCISDCHGRFMV